VARIVLLVTSPRLPAGLLTAEAWDLVRAAPVRTAADSPQVAALRHAGVAVTVESPDVDALLAAADEHGTVVWLAGAEGGAAGAEAGAAGSEEAFARTLGLRLAREPGRAELELMYGSWDPPGARLLDAVAVMARLVAPDGDPWKRSQTHLSLAPYLLEEAYEAYDAILADDTAALREELGDVLLQIVLHAALAEPGWSVDDVAAGLVDKLIRRNPHVFAGAEVGGLDDIVANWERIKQEEKARSSPLDGIALAQPALSLAAKVLGRLAKTGAAPPLPDPDGLGAELLRLVAAARQRGEDPEAALRAAVLAYMAEARAAEPPPPAP
jgi:XTP/dITP diphosphohydrolase